MRLSSIIVGIVLVTLVSTGFMLFLADGINQYQPTGIPDNYNDSFRSIQQSLDSFNSTVSRVNNTLYQEAKNSNPITDFIGFFFGQGYAAAKTLVNGVSLNFIIVDEASKNITGYSGFGQLIKSAITLLIVVFIILLLLHFIIKSDWI